MGGLLPIPPVQVDVFWSLLDASATRSDRLAGWLFCRLRPLGPAMETPTEGIRLYMVMDQ